MGWIPTGVWPFRVWIQGLIVLLCVAFKKSLDCDSVFPAAHSLGGCNRGKPMERKAKPERKPSMGQLREALQAELPAIREGRELRETRGRKSSYSREVFLKVCEHMYAGKPTAEALDAEGIASSTFYGWLERDATANTNTPEGVEIVEESLFCRNVFARARKALADHAFSEALSRARAIAERDDIESAHVSATKLLVDTLKWYAERLNPGVYAEQPIQPLAQTVHNVTNNLTIDSSALDGEQRNNLRAMLLQARDSKLISG
jgi:hypothetical protein